MHGRIVGCMMMHGRIVLYAVAMWERWVHGYVWCLVIDTSHSSDRPHYVSLFICYLIIDRSQMHSRRPGHDHVPNEGFGSLEKAHPRPVETFGNLNRETLLIRDEIFSWAKPMTAETEERVI